MENPILWRAFAARRDTLVGLHHMHNISAQQVSTTIEHTGLKLSNKGLNEFYLRHGCPADVADLIVQFGFDERIAPAILIYSHAHAHVHVHANAHTHAFMHMHMHICIYSIILQHRPLPVTSRSTAQEAGRTGH